MPGMPQADAAQLPTADEFAESAMGVEVRLSRSPVLRRQAEQQTRKLLQRGTRIERYRVRGTSSRGSLGQENNATMGHEKTRPCGRESLSLITLIGGLMTLNPRDRV